MTNEKGLLDIAKWDLKYCKMGIGSTNDDIGINIAAYHLSQSVDKILKYLLNLNGIKYPKTHFIDVLMEICRDNDIRYPTELDMVSHALTTWAVESRYSPNRLTSLNSLVNIMEIIEDWVVEIETTQE